MKRLEMRSERRLEPKNIFLATIIVYSTIPLSGFATDIYLPSMPSMALDFHTSQGNIQLTLSLFLISYGIAQMLAGIFLDSLGRYKISLTSLLVFSLSCFIIATTHQLAVIYAMRIVQGISTSFIIVSGRAFFVDVYEGDKKKNLLSLMTIVWSVGPIVAPFVGGYLEEVLGWRSNFYALSIYGLLIFFAQLLFNGETIRHRIKLTAESMLKSYGTILTTRDFISGILLLGFSYAMVMFFSLSGAFIIENKNGYSPVVAGYVSLILGVAWMCGGFIGKALIRRNFLTKIKVGIGIQLLLTLAMMASGSIFNNLWLLIIFAFAIHLTAGFIFNNFFTYCLSRFPQFAGIAGGLTGGLGYVLTAILSYGLIALVSPESQRSLGEGYFIIGFFGIVVLWFSRKMYQVQ